MVGEMSELDLWFDRRYFARDWLAPNPTDGQLRVRELAQEARDTAQLCAWIHADGSLLEDEVTRQPAGASEALRAYAEAQQLRSDARYEAESGRRDAPSAVRTVIPGGWNHGEPLARFIIPDERFSRTLLALFHEGVMRERSEPCGRIFAGDEIFYASGGSHRTMAHVLAGVLIPPNVGLLSVVHATPDRAALLRLQELEAAGSDAVSLCPQWVGRDSPAEREAEYREWRARIMSPEPVVTNRRGVRRWTWRGRGRRPGQGRRFGR